MGSFAGFRSAKTVRLVGIGSAFWIRLRFLETVRLFQMDFAAAAFVVAVVVVFTTTSRLVAPNLN